MQIRPSLTDFKKWKSFVPAEGDLLFLDKKSAKLFPDLNFPRYSIEQVRAQSQTLWTLQMRSWYGYVLNQASLCIWIPRGSLEQLTRDTIQKLANVQACLKVPTLISPSLLSASLRSKIKPYAGRHWLSSATWLSLSQSERSEAIQAWGQQNRVFLHKGPSFGDLPRSVQGLLFKTGFKKLLNRYALTSGPNCLACAAAMATGGKHALGIANQWMHGPPFLSHLKSIGYKKTSKTNPQVGDVLVFSRSTEIVHAGYYLGEGFYFEKPGQDFYEPYRMETFHSWKKHWPGTTLSIWRSPKP
jgi:hypothetical protein